METKNEISSFLVSSVCFKLGCNREQAEEYIIYSLSALSVQTAVIEQIDFLKKVGLLPNLNSVEDDD